MRATTVLSLGLALLLAPRGLWADAAADAAAFQSALSDNLKAGASFLVQPFAKGLAFSVGSQAFSPVQAKPLLGFNLGLGGGATVTGIDKSGVKAAALNNGTDLSGLAAGLPDSLPIPLGTLSGHLGLPKLLFFESADLGLRLTAFNADASDVSVKLAGGGLELRGNLFEAGLVSPLTLTLGLGVETLKTQIHYGKAPAAVSGSYGASSYSGNTRYVADLDSQITATTLKASVSRKLLFFTPYAGAAVNLLSGDATFRAAQEGTLAFSGPGPSSYTLSNTIEGKASQAAPLLDARVAAGFELNFLVLYIAVGGEYGLLSQGAGAHAQLGFQFR